MYQKLRHYPVGAFREKIMRKGNRLQTKLLQFSYDHPKLEKEIKKLRSSADELCRTLDSLPPKAFKAQKNKKN